jgi:dipeptidase
VGPKATVDGSTFNTHTADCGECDWRINKVPAKDHPAGAMRPIFVISGVYPRQVRTDRGDTWDPSNLEDMPQKKEWLLNEGKLIIGEIPQVRHTYALIEGMYGIMNEHQVAIGESTCAARLWTKPVSAGGLALLEASELSQIALERATTARDAIKIMGALAEQYGFYGADWGTTMGADFPLGEGGEALTVRRHTAFCCVVFCCVVLYCIVLCCALLCCALLCCALLCCVVLY